MKHLRDINKTYFEHFRGAIYYAGVLFCLGTILIIHALIPCIFVTTASDKLQKLIKMMKGTSTEDDKE
jgi:hypothetical protein